MCISTTHRQLKCGSWDWADSISKEITLGAEGLETDPYNSGNNCICALVMPAHQHASMPAHQHWRGADRHIPGVHSPTSSVSSKAARDSVLKQVNKSRQWLKKRFPRLTHCLHLSAHTHVPAHRQHRETQTCRFWISLLGQVLRFFDYTKIAGNAIQAVFR